MDGFYLRSNLKGDKMEIPDIELSNTIQTAETANGTTCWTMLSDKYVKASVENVELKLS